MLNSARTFPEHSSSASSPFSISQDSISHPKSIEFESEESNLAAVKQVIKLLLLSTDGAFCILVRSYLLHLGFSVFICTSAERAESLFLERYDIDIWLIDVQSLGIEAMYFATKVHDLHPGIPIILISGAQRSESCLQRLFWQNWIQIRKPIGLLELLEKIHRVLSSTTASPKTMEQSDDWDHLEAKEITRLTRFRITH